MRSGYVLQIEQDTTVSATRTLTVLPLRFRAVQGASPKVSPRLVIRQIRSAAMPIHKAVRTRIEPSDTQPLSGGSARSDFCRVPAGPAPQREPPETNAPAAPATN